MVKRTAEAAKKNTFNKNGFNSSLTVQALRCRCNPVVLYKVFLHTCPTLAQTTAVMYRLHHTNTLINCFSAWLTCQCAHILAWSLYVNQQLSCTSSVHLAAASARLREEQFETGCRHCQQHAYAALPQTPPGRCKPGGSTVELSLAHGSKYTLHYVKCSLSSPYKAQAMLGLLRHKHHQTTPSNSCKCATNASPPQSNTTPCDARLCIPLLLSAFMQHAGGTMT